jgi:hypothetical protein
MYIVFDNDYNVVTQGEDRAKVVKSLKNEAEGTYTLAKLMQKITVRPPKRESENVVVAGPSFSPRQGKTKTGTHVVSEQEG